MFTTESITKEELLFKLISLGFICCKTKCKTWNTAFLYKSNGSALCILLRKNGIDFRFYSKYENGLTIKDDNLLYMEGGEVFRNHYNRSNKIINTKAYNIAANYKSGVISKSMKIEDGKSYLLNQDIETIARRSKKI